MIIILINNQSRNKAVKVLRKINYLTDAEIHKQTKSHAPYVYFSHM